MVDHGLYMVISWSTMFLKHGRPCLKHGQPCFDRVHFTGAHKILLTKKVSYPIKTVRLT